MIYHFIVGGIIPFFGFVKVYCLIDKNTGMLRFPKTQEESTICTHYYNMLSFEWLWKGWGIAFGQPKKISSEETKI